MRVLWFLLGRTTKLNGEESLSSPLREKAANEIDIPALTWASPDDSVLSNPSHYEGTHPL